MTSNQLLIDTVLADWKLWTGRLEQGLAAMPDEKLDVQVAPNKNRIRYIIGHLAAVNDRLLPSLGVEERLHPELDEAFFTNPDRSQPDTVSNADLKKALVEVNAAVTSALETMPPEDWLKRHASVSEEDFAKEPLRNRLAMVLSRTSHVAMHLGQVVLTR